MQSPTQTLAHWVVQSRWTDVAPQAKAAVSRAWLNWLGCALGGVRDPAFERLLGAVAPFGGKGEVPLIGRVEKTDPGTAALLHAFASNILDYDDTHWATAIHPSGPVASALVAWSSQPGVTVSGQDLLHALLLGMEVACRIGLAVSPGHYEKGWHITGTCGIFGAAAGVGRLMGLTPRQMTWALGHAATQSAGLVASLGTMAKSLNIAHAARNGLVAAQWARHDITASDQVLEAGFGFARVLGEGPLSGALCDSLGLHWEAARNTFKPYPCGFVLHPVLDACLNATQPLTVRSEALEQLEQVIVSVHPLARVRADRPDPVDGLESKLSAQHAVAVALVHGDAGVQRFTDEAVRDPAVRACRDKTRVQEDKALTTDSARVQVKWLDARMDSRETRGPSDQTPCAMSDAALARKFRDLVAYGAPHCDPDRLLAAIEQFPQSARALDLVGLTRPGA